MYPEPMGVQIAGRADRLSSLGDGALGHILSFLPAAEAARAAALSRRWRHVFAAVHTISFSESKRPIPDDDDYTGRWDWSPGWGQSDDDDAEPKAVPSQPFVNAVGAALHGRHRGAHAAGAPLRGLRVAFDEFDGADAVSATAVDGWLAYALHQAGDDLHIDLRLGREPICARAHTLHRCGPDLPHAFSDEEDLYKYPVPRSLFTCAALRSLRLGSCRLDPPAAIALPSLHTLHLTHVNNWMGAAHIQRLVAACPCLADLTLEACDTGSALSLLDKRLRRLALRCCHGLATVAVDSSELRTFEYSGAVPGPSFLNMHGRCRISSCTLNFCGEEATDLKEMSRVMSFLKLFAGVTKLHLKSARLGSGIGHNILSSALEFPDLCHLELTGMLPEDDIATVSAVTRILQRTPSLQTLSFFFLPEPEVPDYNCYDEEKLRAVHRLRYSEHVPLTMADGEEIPCLRDRTREINFVHYQGAMAQRILAMYLLRKAPVVDEVYCEFARGPLFIQTKLMEEIKGWVLYKSANMMFF